MRRPHVHDTGPSPSATMLPLPKYALVPMKGAGAGENWVSRSARFWTEGAASGEYESSQGVSPKKSQALRTGPVGGAPCAK